MYLRLSEKPEDTT
jgi:hypothetical protein